MHPANGEIRAIAQWIDRVAAKVPEQLKVSRLAVALVGIGGAVPISVGPTVGSLFAGKPTDGISDRLRGLKRGSIASSREQRAKDRTGRDSLGRFFHCLANITPDGTMGSSFPSVPFVPLSGLITFL